jgi:hypothetical protein
MADHGHPPNSQHRISLEMDCSLGAIGYHDSCLRLAGLLKR